MLDEPLAVLLHVGVVIAHTALVLLAIANQRHITIGNARSRITVNVNRLLSVQVINHIEQGEIVGKSLANLLFTMMHDIDGRALASSQCDINHAAKVRRKRQSAVTRIASKLSHFAEDCIGGSSALQNEPLMSSLQILQVAIPITGCATTVDLI